MPHTNSVGSYVALTYESYPTAPSSTDIIGGLQNIWSLFNPQLAGAGGGAGVGECVCPSGYTPSGNVCVKTGSPTIACLPSFAPPVFPGGSTPTPTSTPTSAQNQKCEECKADAAKRGIPVFAMCYPEPCLFSTGSEVKPFAFDWAKVAPLLIIVIGIILLILALTLIVR